MKYLCLLREWPYVRRICAFHEKSFDMKSWCLLREGLLLEVVVPSQRRVLVKKVHAFHEKGF